MESAAEFWTAKAALDWQVEMGADEAIGDTPIDRYALADKKPAPKVEVVAETPALPDEAVKIDGAEVARV